MRRSLVCLLALGCLAAGAKVRAQEPVEKELEFVRKLRAKGYIDLARARLELLQKRNDPALAGVLPLEQARTILAEAREKDAAQRFGLFEQARTFLKDYTDKNAGKPEAAQGKLELARLSSYEGEALLTKAMRELDPAAQQELAKPAEAKFVLAADELEEASKVLKALIDNPQTSESVKKQLEQDLTQARFDKGINYINQARTYVNTAKEDVNLKRAQIVQKDAMPIFESLKNDEALSVRSLANAWLMKIAMESQSGPAAVENYYKRVMGITAPDARAGQRWARLFDMQEILTTGKSPRIVVGKGKGVTPLDKLHLVQTLGTSWLKDYPASIHSPEGEAVLWELANAYFLEAKEIENDKKVKTTPEKLAARTAVLYADAQKYFGMLAQGEGDYSEKANKANLSISFQLMGKRKDFRTFNELYLKGQFELMEVQDLAGKRAKAQASGHTKDADKYDEEWKAKLKEIVQTFSRAIALANSRTPIAKLDDARYYQMAAFLQSGDLMRAAVSGEALGRTRPPTRHAPAGAGYAIQAYATLLTGKYNGEGTRERLQALIDYVLSPECQRFWSSDPVTGVARYQSAMLAKQDGDYKRAIADLEHLPRDFPGYIYAQGQLVFIALATRKDNQNLSEKEKAELTEKVRQAVDRMPPLPSDADSTTAYMYFLAKLEKAKLLYADGYRLLRDEPLKAEQKYKEMGKFITDLATTFDKVPIKLTPENRATIDFELHVMHKYADLGLAEVQYREGKFDEVLKVTQPTLDAVKKLDNGQGPIKLRDYQVTGDILGLALRAEVQKGNIKTAKQSLDVIKRLSDEGDKVDPAVKDRVVSSLLTEIGAQVLDLEKKGRKKELAKVVGSFTTFLDTLLKDTDPKKMTLNERLILARAFSGLGMHTKAAELYEQVPPTSVLESKKQIADMTEDERKELGEYWSLRWELVKELRAAKEYDKALTVVQSWLKHPKAMFAMPYGQMELNSILDDTGKYGAAFQGWTKLNTALQKKAGQDPKMKQLYFDSYFYRTRSVFKYALNDPGVKNKQKIVDAAAGWIVKLEFSATRDGWERVGARFQELLQEEPMLREAYDRLKKDRKDSAK